MGKHRQFSADLKLRVVLESLQDQKSQAQIAREHNVTDELVSRWRQEFLERASEIFRGVHRLSRNGLRNLSVWSANLPSN